jgi:hypothetical protein
MINNYTPPITPEKAKIGYADFAHMDVVQEEPKKGRKHEETPENELTEAEVKLIEGLRDGSTSFDTVQREVAARAFEKILRNPSSLKVKDWLQSELIKIKKEESQAKIGAMEVFLRKMFSGSLPTNCSKCGTPLFAEAQIVHESITNPDILPF